MWKLFSYDQIRSPQRKHNPWSLLEVEQSMDTIYMKFCSLFKFNVLCSNLVFSFCHQKIRWQKVSSYKNVSEGRHRCESAAMLWNPEANELILPHFVVLSQCFRIFISKPWTSKCFVIYIYLYFRREETKKQKKTTINIGWFFFRAAWKLFGFAACWANSRCQR